MEVAKNILKLQIGMRLIKRCYRTEMVSYKFPITPLKSEARAELLGRRS